MILWTLEMSYSYSHTVASDSCEYFPQYELILLLIPIRNTKLGDNLVSIFNNKHMMNHYMIQQ